MIIRSPEKKNTKEFSSLLKVVDFLKKKKWSHCLTYDQIYMRVKQGKPILVAFKPWIMVKLKPLK